jgi:hypothetical protein
MRSPAHGGSVGRLSRLVLPPWAATYSERSAGDDGSPAVRITRGPGSKEKDLREEGFSRSWLADLAG